MSLTYIGDLAAQALRRRCLRRSRLGRSSQSVARVGLDDRGTLATKVLIIGPSGGVGTFAVQIAKSFDAEVTGVCSTKKVDLVRSLGADHVIDYTQQDFAHGGQRYDLNLHLAGLRSLSDSTTVRPDPPRDR